MSEEVVVVMQRMFKSKQEGRLFEGQEREKKREMYAKRSTIKKKVKEGKREEEL